ncbi:GLPGLI family protein [Ulvibacter sp. MAR_2010_11]|uniref:GLPGLI family protein n=1 Tax=Ulvibacter sp. MAR_2010_11 TaxID=1250229 RepID=UPI000C2B796B|nr:GLPGLI family protein [Ulvibacter sp. MAR_2010_11]PKA83351.1 GLPGLI family protein [Ulvibacter sp. MAR_2010_11]
MKQILLVVLSLFSISTFAQNISGQAFYESKTTVDMDNFGGREMSEDMKKQIAERMKSMLEKTYILTFTKNESIYKEDEKLETGADNGGFRMMMGSFTAGPQYKNIEANQILEEREFFGKQFLINDTISNLDWKLEKESKQIGQYVAFKATAIKKIDPNDMSMVRRRRDRNREGGDEKKEQETAKDTTKTADPFDEIEVPKEVLVTAWFTPQIPVANGPGEYAGLPGLILELNIDRTTILCSKIVMNPKEAESIAPLKKGKEVSREEFNKIVKEKTDEMRENFRGGNRRGGGRFGG